MSENSDKKSGKKPYKKPELRAIELVADEVLAVGCKVRGGTSAFGNKSTCVSPTTCFSQGS